MEIKERKEVYKQLEDQNGKNHQIAVAIEEMSELTKELSKYLREDSYTNSKKICEEMADVKVVIEQLERFFDPEQKLVPFTMDYKLERLKMFYLKKPLIATEQKEELLIIYNNKEYDTIHLTNEAISDLLKRGGYYKREAKETKSNIIFGRLFKYTKYYELEIKFTSLESFKTLHFTNENQLVEQNKFLNLCMRKLHFLPNSTDRVNWLNKVNDLLANLIIVDN